MRLFELKISACDQIAMRLRRPHDPGNVLHSRSEVAERLEDASDAIAEHSLPAKQPSEPPASASPPPQPLIDVKGHRVINGFKHTA